MVGAETEGPPQHNPHFAEVASWEEAADMLCFEPRRPRDTLGQPLHSLSIFVRDHKHRDLEVEDRVLEAHFGTFSISQSWKGKKEARRWALEVSYGPAARELLIGGHEGRTYELGPEVPPDDIDGRSPAVVTWYEGGMSFFLASVELPVQSLLTVARSLFDPGAAGPGPGRHP